MYRSERLIFVNEIGDQIEFSSTPLSTYFVKNATGFDDAENEVTTIISGGQPGETLISHRITRKSPQLIGVINTQNETERYALKRNFNRIINPQLKGRLIHEYMGNVRIAENVSILARKWSKVTLFEEFIIDFAILYPFWNKEKEIRTDIASWIGEWIFPFEIDDDEGMVFGTREPSLIVNVYNNSDAETGIEIEFYAESTVTNPRLLNVVTGEFIQVNVVLNYGDSLKITTHHGNKEADITRDNGTVEDVMRWLEPGSTFLQLRLKDNMFQYSADGGEDYLGVAITHREIEV